MKIISIILVCFFSLNIFAQSDSNTVEDQPDKPFGIAMGVGYFTASLDSALIGNAIIDDNGVIRVTDERERITRLFPTIMGYIKPFYRSEKIILKNIYTGITAGVNDGVSNEGSGFSLAIGASLGIAIKDTGHFGLFGGWIYDPTVKRLPNDFSDGEKAPDGYGPNTTIPFKTTNIKYPSIGFNFSISL